MTWDAVFRAADAIGRRDGEWAGHPVPLPGSPLVVEPTHIMARNAGGTRVSIDRDDGDVPSLPDGLTVINSWYCQRRAATVYVVDVFGRRVCRVLRDDAWPLRFKMLMDSINPWMHKSTGQEAMACEKLRSLVSEHQWNLYMVSGMFMERSKRSGAVYLFRKGRPTVAMLTQDSGNMQASVALCLHPIAYYEATWCGALCPTDDVIAHLLLMRADEHFFWRKATHHPLHSACSGV